MVRSALSDTSHRPLYTLSHPRRSILSRTDTPAFAYTILTLTAFFLACNHIIGRGVQGEVPPVGLSFWRWVVGAFILLPFVLPRMRERLPVYRQHWRAFTLLGFFMIGSTTLILVALTMTYAINVSLINAVQPTLTVLFAWLFMKEALSGVRGLGIVCGISGVIIMVSRASWEVLASLQLQAGDFIAILAMCGFSAYALNLYRLPQELTVIEALFGITVAGTVILLPFYVYETLTVGPVPVNQTSISAIVALALLVSVFGNMMWNSANRIIGPSRASIFINLIPVFGTVLAIIFLNEQLLPYHVFGGVLVVVGLFLAAGSGRKRPLPGGQGRS